MIRSLYTFSESSSAWPHAFVHEAERLKALLGDELVITHHIGSTSVPGLAAKPIIDLLPLVRDLHAIDALTSRFAAAGYKVWGDYGLPGRRYFTRDRDGHRTHNLHIYGVGDPAIERHLAFCAYLRSHAEACQAYEALKRKVYDLHPADIDAYNAGKNDWIKALEPIAIAWYREQNKILDQRYSYV